MQNTTIERLRQATADTVAKTIEIRLQVSPYVIETRKHAIHEICDSVRDDFAAPSVRTRRAERILQNPSTLAAKGLAI